MYVKDIFIASDNRPGILLMFRDKTKSNFNHNYTIMFLKKLYLLISCCVVLSALMGQNKPNDYKAAWKKIDSLIHKRGLTESALTEVNKIYTLAKKEKNDPQIIKALLFRMNLQQMKEENAIQKNIQDLEKEIAVASDPSRSIL